MDRTGWAQTRAVSLAAIVRKGERINLTRDDTYRADDRSSTEPTDPLALVAGTVEGRHEDVIAGNPSLAALYSMWADRDMGYAKATKVMDEGSIESVRNWRKQEANEMPPSVRARAWARANAWYPPQHGQGTGNDRAEGGLVSWVE